MEDSQSLDYVKASARALGLALDDARAQAVAAHFARTLALARLLDQAELSPEHEPAEVFRPAPFPAITDDEVA